MLNGRLWHDICVVGPCIYVVGGASFEGPMCHDIEKTEQYCIRKDRWIELPEKCDIKDYPREPTIVAVKNRYVFCFGGSHAGE